MSLVNPSQKAKLTNAAIQFSYLPRTLRLVWQAGPRWTTAWVGLLLCQALLPVATIYLTKLLVNELIHVSSQGLGLGPHLRPLALLAALTAGTMVLAQVLQSISDWVRTAQAEHIEDYVKQLLHDKSVAVDLGFYDSADYYDRLDQARSEASTRSRALLENGGSLLQNGITLLAMGTILLPYGAWVPVVLFLSTLPAFAVVLRFDRRYHKWWQKTTTTRRWIYYYDLLLTHAVFAPELRLFDLGTHFQSRYRQLRSQLRSERIRQMRNLVFGRLGAGVVSVLVSGMALAWMMVYILQGHLTFGDLTLFYQALQQGQGLAAAVLGSVGQIYANSLFLGNLYAFLGLDSQVVDPPHPVPAPEVLQSGIVFRNVTFRYPNTDRLALENFDLTIPAGKIVALVGPNGAGKTTLLKLLCRFYDPEQGSIELDGINIRDMALQELRRRITVLFQFPEHYQFTARENIALGDVTADADPPQIEAAACAAGAHTLIANLPAGYDTQLGRMFAEGAELSGGEWQRVAMARAFHRQAPIIVLDEPTSALDSWAEAEWFERFRHLSEGRTAIVITHRFTIAMRADIIHVMQDGRIAESGSHHELVARRGLYARSWTQQMEAAGMPEFGLHSMARNGRKNEREVLG